VHFEWINEEDTTVFVRLVAGVREYNFEHMVSEKSRPLSVVARGEDGDLIRRLSERTIYKNVLIVVVWVDTETRVTWLGRKLMELAEFEVVTGFPPSPERYFLLKNYF